MTNIIRADVYRIVRGKGLYITLAIFLAIIILQIVGGTNVNAGVNINLDIDIFEIIDIENFNVNEFSFADFLHSPTGVEAPFQVMEGSANIMYILLPLIIFIGAADFSSGAAKNTLSGGISRKKYYCAKLILSCVCCALLLLAYVVLSTLMATAINGFGGAFNGEYVLRVLRIFLPQLLLCLSIVCVGNFFVFTFQKSAAVNGLYIAFLLVPSVIIFTLSFISARFERLFDYELTMNIGALVQIDSMSAGDIARIAIVGTAYIIVAVVCGFVIFRRTEIK